MGSGKHTTGVILFDRVSSILELARGKVLRTVNQQMVLAYGLIGREIVLEIQQGAKRAEYGNRVIRELSEKLTNKYGPGYSVASLKGFRQFYVAFSDRFPQIPQIRYSSGSQFEVFESEGHFSDRLGWSHYRALMRIPKPEARLYYEQEAIACGWIVEELQRQIHTFTFERLQANQQKPVVTQSVPPVLAIPKALSPREVFKSPSILEFLTLPDLPLLHENQLEQAVIDNLQGFLLELGKGFAFVARQKQLRFEDQLYYVDLVFYNYLLKCFVLIDLKIGEISHQDVGQMDGYVRLFEDQHRIIGDNPTIGLILCSAKNHAVAKYSVLSENQQLFASQYLLYLPSEKELEQQIQKNRLQWEYRRNENSQHQEPSKHETNHPK
jgi:predicted nuclease of restriction endonuclease-like (RecB) superfamily